MSSNLSKNYFELFGLSASFDINQQQLNERYRDLQRTTHPDRYATSSDRERRLSVQYTAQINEAYRALKSPLDRARYLLTLQGVEFDDERETTCEAEFLIEQMQCHEAMGEVRSANDPMSTLSQLMHDINLKIDTMTKELSMLFANGTSNSLATAKQIVLKLQFLHRLSQRAEELEEELVDLL